MPDHIPYKGEVLFPQGGLLEAAANLCACLRKLDKAELDIIYSEPVPEGWTGKSNYGQTAKSFR